MKKIHLKQYARYLPADLETPISLFLRLCAYETSDAAQDAILLESAEVDGRWGRFSILAANPALRIACEQGHLAVTCFDDAVRPLEHLHGMPFLDGFRQILQSLEIDPPEGADNLKDLPALTRALYGYFGFDMVSCICPKLATIMPPEEADCIMILPRIILIFDHLYNRLCRISLQRPEDEEHVAAFSERSWDASPISWSAQLPAGGEHIEQSPSAEGYKDYVRTIKKLLREGEAIQVVPSVRFSTPFPGDPFPLYRRLRQINASPYMFYMRFPGRTLLGSSPEVMVRCAKNTVTLAPIAGTRPRGRDEREDAFLASELLRDPKERAEHVMLVDLGRNDLGRIAQPGSVTVTRSMQIEKFSHVMHITSTIAAQVAQGFDAVDVLAATFPAGTVSGAPKIRALEIIRELEGRPRGPYAGCIGWIGLDSDSVNLDMGITIRSLWQQEGTLFWQAGSGIVHDSDPDREWMEVYTKSAIMRHSLFPTEDSYAPTHR